MQVRKYVTHHRLACRHVALNLSLELSPYVSTKNTYRSSEATSVKMTQTASQHVTFYQKMFCIYSAHVPVQ